jgi:siderophore synthetase component
LDLEEKKVLAFLQQERPELVNLFLDHLQSARCGILHRLLQAVVRENIGGVGERMVWRPQSHVLEAHITPAFILSLPVQRRYSMGRFDLRGEVILKKLQQHEVVQHPTQLLKQLWEAGLSQDKSFTRQFGRFCQEMQNSVANYALALAGAQLRRERLQQEAGEDSKNCLQWVERKRTNDPWFSPLIFFEQWFVDGHPLHPGAKLKMGMDVADVIGYSPEWGAVPGMVPIAVHKKDCQISTLDGETATEILYREHLGLQKHVENTLRERKLPVRDYEVILVHPWQFQHVILSLFAAEIKQKIVVPVPNYRIDAAALITLRTVAPMQRYGEGKHHIKTALAIQITGSERTFTPQSVYNGPIVARILREIQKRERFFGGEFLIMEEHVGVFYHPASYQGDHELSAEECLLKNENLNFILRENIESHVQPDEIAMPASALTAICPLSGELIVGELIKEYAVHHSLKEQRKAAVHFIYQYTKMALPGFLTLMSRYGISLEGHLQNSVAVFAKGVPVRMIVRDLAGVEIWRKRLVK